LCGFDGLLGLRGACGAAEAFALGAVPGARDAVGLGRLRLGSGGAESASLLLLAWLFSLFKFVPQRTLMVLASDAYCLLYLQAQ
jgi:hypothetical protein